jgi:predicted nucleic acid-binding Zn ribbon protein
MRSITNQIVALNAKIERARRLVAEHQRDAPARGDQATKSYIIVHDLTHWLHSLEARRENLLLQSHLMAQRESEVA